ELKEKGLLNIKCLATSHSKVLLCRLREVSLAVTKEVTNLRSKVSHSAIVTLGELFVTLKKDMDSEVDEAARVLLQMVWNPPEFLQKAASQSLGIMLENVTPSRALTALMDGAQHRHVLVRNCAAQHLLTVMEKIGPKKLADTPVRAERLLCLAIFDHFVPRLCDYNKKVKQQALEALYLMIVTLRDALNPVLIRLVEAIINNLNSKHLGIYGAAVRSLEASTVYL
ncbi:TOG array regulator of axonemal microtubules protein 2-like, partial [Empidonax traillii]|uniref:TOG array regulator of axonemal microtubules protein 2-like n=1 Tax=Empidonax traillii TaxID=164674 RepID=UPI000FFD15FA